jgi:hypothetical protein
MRPWYEKLRSDRTSSLSKHIGRELFGGPLKLLDDISSSPLNTFSVPARFLAVYVVITHEEHFVYLYVQFRLGELIGRRGRLLQYVQANEQSEIRAHQESRVPPTAQLRRYYRGPQLD